MSRGAGNAVQRCDVPPSSVAVSTAGASMHASPPGLPRRPSATCPRASAPAAIEARVGERMHGMLASGAGCWPRVDSTSTAVNEGRMGWCERRTSPRCRDETCGGHGRGPASPDRRGCRYVWLPLCVPPTGSCVAEASVGQKRWQRGCTERRAIVVAASVGLPEGERANETRFHAVWLRC